MTHRTMTRQTIVLAVLTAAILLLMAVTVNAAPDAARCLWTRHYGTARATLKCPGRLPVAYQWKAGYGWITVDQTTPPF